MTGRPDAALHGRRDACRYLALGPSIGAASRCAQMNWNEVLRVANLPEYRNVKECRALVNEVAHELKIESPYHPD